MNKGSFYGFDKPAYIAWYKKRHPNFMMSGMEAVLVAIQSEVFTLGDGTDVVAVGFYNADKTYCHAGSFGFPTHLILSKEQ